MRLFRLIAPHFLIWFHATFDQSERDMACLTTRLPSPLRPRPPSPSAAALGPSRLRPRFFAPASAGRPPAAIVRALRAGQSGRAISSGCGLLGSRLRTRRRARQACDARPRQSVGLPARVPSPLCRSSFRTAREGRDGAHLSKMTALRLSALSRTPCGSGGRPISPERGVSLNFPSLAASCYIGRGPPRDIEPTDEYRSMT